MADLRSDQARQQQGTDRVPEHAPRPATPPVSSSGGPPWQAGMLEAAAVPWCPPSAVALWRDGVPPESTPANA